MTDQRGWLYIIGCTETSLIKIGITELSGLRFSNLQNGCPFALRLESAFRTHLFKMVEAILHDRLKKFCAHGEWFDVPIPKAISVLQKVAFDLGAHLESVGESELKQINQQIQGVFKRESKTHWKKRALFAARDGVAQ